MKKIIFLLLLVPFITEKSFGWGQTGHRVVGLIAEQHLKSEAKKKVHDLLQNNSLAEVSTWMDDIKSDSTYDHTHDWHWVTIPDGTSYDQSEKSPTGDVIAKIEEIILKLKTHNLSLEEEQKNLKFLVHLIGDLHQPLHAGRGTDRGGNDIKVEWFGKSSNLHRVWDSDMIDSKGVSFSELACFIDRPTETQVKQWQSSPVRDWANESVSYRKQVYNLPVDKKLGYKYSYDNFNLVEQRLMQAGIRLAGVLNEIYG